MPRQPFVRANNARDAFEFFGHAYPALQRHLRETLPAEVLERVAKGVRTDWIPVAIDGQYVQAIFDYLGAEEGKRAYRRFLAEDLVRSPMMRALFEGTVRLFGVSVGGFLRIVPSGFSQSYRDAFDLSVERGSREAVVVFDDVAPEILRFPYVMSWEGIFLGLYDLAHVPPQLHVDVSRAQRRVEARLRW